MRRWSSCSLAGVAVVAATLALLAAAAAAAAAVADTAAAIKPSDVIVGAAGGGEADVGLERVRRFTATTCAANPKSAEEKDTPADDNSPVQISCNFDQDVGTCTWTHKFPMNEGESGTANDVTCLMTANDNGDTCDGAHGDTRIRYQASTQSCGLTISNSKPEDTGYWRVLATGVPNANSGSGGSQQVSREVQVYTWNDTKCAILDRDDNDVDGDTIQTSYNWNTKQKDWEQGKGSYETLELKCIGSYGRPRPTFAWFIENNDDDTLDGDSNFDVDVDGQFMGSEDHNNFIESYESDLNFQLNDKFLAKLAGYSININPVNSIVTFKISCECHQQRSGSDAVATDQPTVTIDMTKSYDDGKLIASTIGLVVGIVVGVVILIIVVAVLIFAKTSGRLCFDDSEYDAVAQKPQQRRAGPQQGGGQPRHS